MTIAAILDLDKAIETFKNTIQKLLELGETSEWDGQRLKEQEEQIRQVSLELAGQSIGILLQRLSEDPLAQQQANQRTQSSRGFGSQSQGKKKVIVTTVGNVEVPLWIDYVLSRQPQKDSSKRKKQRKPGQRGKSKGQGFYPFLRWLGMTEKVTPLVWSTVTSFGMLSASFAVAWGNLKEWGIELSEQRIERLTYRFGEAGIKLREEWLKQHQQGQLPVGETLRGQRVGLSVDGGRTRLRRAKKEKRRANGRRGYHGDWREPKLFTLYAIDEQGQRINTVALPVINDGTFEDVEGFMSLLEMYLVKMGIVHASQVLLLADGAIWIWQRIPALLKRLGLSDEQIIELIDFYHAAEHLRQFSELAFGKTPQARQWFETARSTLKHKSFATLLNDMQALAKASTSKRKQEKLHKQLQYFSEQPHRFAYEQVQSLKLPIGSGSIESLIRQVVNLRLKGPGKFWLPEHAEIVLHGRCQWAAGQWHQFCQRVLTAGLAPKLPSILSLNPTELAAA
jgi:hypothetical protein